MRNMNSKNPTAGRWKNKVIISLWGLFSLGLLLTGLFIYLISRDSFGKLPTTDKLENPQEAQATEIYSSDGKLLGKYYNENRSPVEYENLSPNLVNALIATEDVRYREHAGIDFKGLTRAFIKPFFLQKSAGGASTISQ